MLSNPREYTMDLQSKQNFLTEMAEANEDDVEMEKFFEGADEDEEEEDKIQVDKKDVIRKVNEAVVIKLSLEKKNFIIEENCF